MSAALPLCQLTQYQNQEFVPDVPGQAVVLCAVTLQTTLRSPFYWIPFARVCSRTILPRKSSRIIFGVSVSSRPDAEQRPDAPARLHHPPYSHRFVTARHAAG